MGSLEEFAFQAESHNFTAEGLIQRNEASFALGLFFLPRSTQRDLRFTVQVRGHEMQLRGCPPYMRYEPRSFGVIAEENAWSLWKE